MIARPHYIDRLRSLKDLRIIKTLSGVRRSGKSTILELFKDHLLSSGVEAERIQMINFEDLANATLLDYQVLHDSITTSLVPEKMNYIFLDEIQQVPHFERAVDSLYIKKNVDLYITGSNAHLLSGELATLLSGRYVTIPVLPLSFAEYWSSQAEGDQYSAFEIYLERGGLPYTTEISDDNTYRAYVDGIINSVLVKDVLSRHTLANSTLIERLARFLTDSSGSLVSIKKIADTLTSMGERTTSATVASYLNSLTEAFLFYRCDRFDVAGRWYLSTHAKYYPVDQALRRALLGRKRPDRGHRLEGVVYMELTRRGHAVFVGTIKGLEIDFVAEKDGVTEYYQVAMATAQKEVYEREIAPFLLIRDNYRKILLSEDRGSFNDRGIEQYNIVEWLLGR